MPKKRKKNQLRKKKVKSRKKNSKRRKVVKKKSKVEESPELIFKTKPEWIKSVLTNKSQYQNKYKD